MAAAPKKKKKGKKSGCAQRHPCEPTTRCLLRSSHRRHASACCAIHHSTAQRDSRLHLVSSPCACVQARQDAALQLGDLRHQVPQRPHGEWVAHPASSLALAHWPPSSSGSGRRCPHMTDGAPACLPGSTLAFLPLHTRLAHLANRQPRIVSACSAATHTQQPRRTWGARETIAEMWMCGIGGARWRRRCRRAPPLRPTHRFGSTQRTSVRGPPPSSPDTPHIHLVLPVRRKQWGGVGTCTCVAPSDMVAGGAGEYTKTKKLYWKGTYEDMEEQHLKIRVRRCSRARDCVCASSPCERRPPSRVSYL